MSDYLEGYSKGYDAAADHYTDRIAQLETELANERKLKNIYFDEWQDANARERALREALEFYANERTYQSSTVYMCGHSGASKIETDGGRRARAVLEETNGGKQ
jgi:hypothetical protein